MARARLVVALSALFALLDAPLGGCVSDLDPSALEFACFAPSDCAAGFACAETGQGTACVRLVGDTADTSASEEVADSTDSSGEDSEPASDSSADGELAGDVITEGPCAAQPVLEAAVGGTRFLLPCADVRVPLPYAHNVCDAFPRWQLPTASDLAALDSCPWEADEAACGEQCRECACGIPVAEACASLPEFLPACGPYWVRTRTPCSGKVYDFEAGRLLFDDTDDVPITAHVVCVQM